MHKIEACSLHVFSNLSVSFAMKSSNDSMSGSLNLSIALKAGWSGKLSRYRSPFSVSYLFQVGILCKLYESCFKILPDRQHHGGLTIFLTAIVLLWDPRLSLRASTKELTSCSMLSSFGLSSSSNFYAFDLSFNAGIPPSAPLLSCSFFVLPMVSTDFAALYSSY